MTTESKTETRDFKHPYMDHIDQIFETEITEEYLKCYPSAKRQVPMISGDFLERYRRRLTRSYAWSILNDEAIEAIASYRRIVSVGAANGYNERLIADRCERNAQDGEGYDYEVQAFDIAPPDINENKYSEGSWYPVTRCNDGSHCVAIALSNPDVTLFMSWPSYAEEWPTETLIGHRRRGGQTFIMVGEGEGGCTGSDSLFDELRDHWDCIEEINILQWEGMNDYVAIYTRKSFTDEPTS